MNSKELLKNWRIILLIVLVLGAAFVVMFNGLKFGIDFKGGTLFQVKLAEKASNAEQLGAIESIIQQRMDWTGLKDTKVSSFGDEFVIIQIAVTDSGEIEQIENLLRKQGKFESILDSNVIFTGADIIHVSKESIKGYGYFKQENSYEWRLPFTLKVQAAMNFAKASFHKCLRTSYDAKTQKSGFECEKTYFFIDRPTNSVLIAPRNRFESDKELLLRGNLTENIPTETKIDDVLKNTGLNLIVLDNNFSEEQKTELTEFSKTFSTAIIPNDLDEESKVFLKELGFKLKEISPKTGIPFVWEASGLKQIISLSEDIANMDLQSIEEVKPITDLYIRGGASSEKDAISRLTELTVLLQSGSLPIPVESISKETVSAVLGKQYFFVTLLMGLIAMIAVALVIFIRYREARVVLPIMFTVLVETFLVIGFAALIGWNLDLSAIAGIIAAVGTGVDDQIIITDELIGRRKKEEDIRVSAGIKRAFFIIVATASVTIATMFPLILFSSGLSKLVGFAITTIAGVLIGITITRPVYGEIMKYVLSKKEK